MNSPLNLKELEQKAFRSFYQDGIWDIFFGIMMLAMYVPTLFDNMDNKGIRTMSLILLELFGIFFLIFGKKYITVPRLGNVEFGKARKRNLVFVFGINLFTLLLALGLFFGFKWLNLDASQTELIAPIGLGFWIAFMTSLMAFFLDFDRLYIYGLIYGATFTAVLLLDWPILFLIAALLILLPGLFFFTRFLMSTKPVEEG